MSNNEDDLLYKDMNRLFYFRISSEERCKPGYNDLKRILRLTEDFNVRYNSDEDF